MRRGVAWIVLLLLGLGWLAFLGFLARQEVLRSRGVRPDFVRYPFLESGSCRRCHSETWEAWNASPHAKALLSLAPRNLSATEKVATCLPCHAPEPVLLSANPGELPLPREERRQEGVGCVTCHLTEEGMAARAGAAEGACRPVPTAALTSVDLCRSCHNAHGTVEQWQASSWAARGVDCRGCHMPGGDHRMPGSHDADGLRRATTLEARVEGRELSVLVGNVGVGHNLPSGRRSRSMELVVDFEPQERQERFRFRNPFQGEGGENTQLPSGRVQRLSWPLPPGSGTARVRLLYQFRPGQPDSKGVLMHELRVAF